jgi:uncharacterized membrane protein YfcA
MTALALAAAVFLGGLVQGTTGIGFALLVAPTVALLRPALLPGFVLLLMLPLNLYVIGREHAAVDWRGVGWVTAGRVLGTLPGWAALVILASWQLDLLVGGATVLASAATLLRPAFAPRPGNCIGAGFVTGVTETATGIGGPPPAMLYQHQPASVLRTSVAVCFLISQSISLVALAAGEVLDGAAIAETLPYFALVAAGAAVSHVSRGLLNAVALRQAVMALAAASGGLLLLRGLLAA